MVQNVPLPYIVIIKLSSIYIFFFSEYRVDVDIMARKITYRKKKKIMAMKIKKKTNKMKINLTVHLRENLS